MIEGGVFIAYPFSRYHGRIRANENVCSIYRTLLSQSHRFILKHATTVAVTGAGGFLGGHICRALVDHGFAVTGIVRSGSDRKLPDDLDVRIEMRDADLLDRRSVAVAFEGADVVIHAAALVSIDGDVGRQASDINVNGANNVLQACFDSGISTLIHVSSVHAYEPIRGITLNPASPLALDSQVPYNRTKGTAHAEVLRAMSEGRVGGSIICPSGLIGPYDDRPSIVGRMLIDIANKQIPMLVREGFWWADVRDVATAVVNAISVASNGNVYFTAGRYATLKHLADTCSGFLGRSVSPPVVPYALAVAGLPFIRAYAAIRNISPLYTRQSLSMVRDCPSTVDHAPANHDLGYDIRPLKETITDALAWFRESGMMS